MVLGGFLAGKINGKSKEKRNRFFMIFCWILEAFRKKSERCDPRSIRKFSSGSWVAAFLAPARTDRKTHSKINEKSFKNQWKINEKMVGFSNWFLNEFRNGFRRVLGSILGLKIDEKTIEKFVEILIVFLIAFWAKKLPKREAKGGPEGLQKPRISGNWPLDPPGTRKGPKINDFS